MSRNRFNVWSASVANPFLPMLMSELRSALAGCQTVLDIGCGNESPLRFLPQKHLVGVDGYSPSLEEARRRGTHDEYVLGNVLKLEELFRGRRFDVCAGMDIIEHLQKEDGWRMLEEMERLAIRRVVIFTPNGFVPQRSRNGDLQEHLSGWTAEEMRQRGYRVIGMLGPKSLRGEYHAIKHKPRTFWALLSLFAHWAYTRNHPDKAAAILCVKNLTQ